MSILRIKKILVSQPEPKTEKSPYFDLADKYNALVMVDDSHATGFVGATGRGSSEYCNVMGRVDIISTTFGKALGGASGGCISGRTEIIDLSIYNCCIIQT